MSNILKVTTPLSGYGDNVKTNPISVNDPNITNVVDMNKVTRQDNKSGESEYEDNRFLLYRNSNFEGFMKVLKKMPSVSELMTDLMFVQARNIINSGINENFAEEISQFLNMIQLSKDEMFPFFKAQAESSAKFSGDFFNLLRSALSESASGEMSLKILDLLKKYNDFTSNGHVFNSILTDLSNIGKNMPSRFSEKLMELVGRLNTDAAQGDVEANADLLKNEMIPYLSKYIKTTNDFGYVRDLISSLALNTARYENGGEKGFLDAFEALMGYNGIRKKFGDADVNRLAEFLLEQDAAKAGGSEMNDKLIRILERGMKGEAGYENVEVFRNILSSILLNESVYMPLLHIMLPMQIDGSMMFSEIWIDPDDEKSSAAADEERKIKFLVKFDIKDVGFFDLILLHQKGRIDMQIYCPEKVIQMDRTIKTGLKEILERNGLAVNSISVEKSGSPVSISEVFPKIYERKNTVNVRV